MRRVILTAFCVYAAIYIARTSFLVDGVRYFTLADDQMVSMRYAENLAAGHGLVWNAGGERIEGFTNLLWVLYMALFHWMALPKPFISACIQISGAIFLLLNLVVVRRLALRVFASESVASIAVALVAFYVPLDNWAFQGTEVSVLTLAVTLGTLWTIDAWETQDVPWRLWLLLGATTLVRPDMIVFAAVGVAAAAAGRPRDAVARLATGAVILALFVAGTTAFRLWYFGDPLPNTYYLKMTGVPTLMRTARGLFVAVVFLAQLAPFIVAVLFTRGLRGMNRSMALLIAVFGAQVAYSVSIGGDAWEAWGGSNRFIAIAMPLFLVVAADGLVLLWNGFTGALATERGAMWAAGARALAPVAVVFTILGTNIVAFSLTTDRTVPFKRLFLLTRPYETDTDESAVRAGLALRAFTTRDAVVGVVWAGAIPYFSERPCVDLLGKMDRRIAREPMRAANTDMPWWAAFHPGHMKWDYEYSIGQLKPDVIQAPLWPVKDRALQATPYLVYDYELQSHSGLWYVRKSSPRLLQLAQR